MVKRAPSAEFAQRHVRRPPSVTRGLLLMAVLWRKLARRFSAGYRPELHYMRGRGPKWHERNSRSPV
jgi:hypothetical protein